MKVQELLEGTWALPDTNEKIDSLAKILSSHATVDQVEDRLYSIIGDDALLDDLADLQRNEPDADARPLIKKHLKRLVSGMSNWNDRPSDSIRRQLELLARLK